MTDTTAGEVERDIADRLEDLLSGNDKMHPVGCSEWEERARVAIDMAKEYILAAPPSPVDKTTGEGVIERMAYGYELMHTAICHMAGTSGADARWYYDRANEVFGRVSPVFAITAESNLPKPGDCLKNYRKALAAQPSASVETLIAEARAKLPDAGPEAIARHLYTYLAANPDMSNALWLIQGLKDVIGRERTEQSRIMGDFKDAAPGAAAVAAHDSFLRANPHLNESDPNVRS